MRSSREQMVFFYFLIVFIAVSICLDRNSAQPFMGESVPAHTGWTTEAGEAMDLSEAPPGVLDLTADISGVDLDGRAPVHDEH